jgi:hypothetical protein
VTTVITGQKASNGRVPTARAVPAFNCVLLENGARVKGDHPSGDDHTWIPPIPAGSRLIDIAAYKVGDEPFVALYALPGGDVGTYVAELA